MDFKDQILQLGEKVSRLKEQIQTEEATKNALIMPFLVALGYDVFNPFEIVPEFTCDIGTKKGEKIDYAIFKNGYPILLIECKHWLQNLNVHDGQLLRYFHVSQAKFGMLTNGIDYRFYTDLVEKNKMDEKPFFEFNITELKENQIEELKKFHKSYFDEDKICDSASDMKYTYELKSIFQRELSNPSEQLIKLFAKQAYPGVLTAKMMELFSGLVKKSINQVISDIIQERLKTALNKEKESNVEKVEEDNQVESNDKGIITTEEEIEAYYIVKSILLPEIPSSRIVYRDAKTVFNVFLDDNNRKPICKLYLSENKKIMALFDEDKNSNKIELDSIEDIYKYADQIRLCAQHYDK